MKTMKKYLKYLHDIAMWSFFTVVLGTAFFYAVTHIREIEDAYEHFHIMPSPRPFNSNDGYTYYSFYNTYNDAVNTEWRESLYCSANDVSDNIAVGGVISNPASRFDASTIDESEWVLTVDQSQITDNSKCFVKHTSLGKLPVYGGSPIRDGVIPVIPIGNNIE